MPTIIGLTGNIATGKSTVINLAHANGADVIDADKVVHQILAENTAVLATICTEFGAEIFEEDGTLIRPALGKIVFSDPAKLKRLEEILHPAVRTVITTFIADSKANVILIEAIKLLEGTLKDLCDTIWVTTCNERIQQERLMEFRGYSAEDALRRIHAQNRQSDKIAQADVVITTNGTMADTIAQFDQAWKNL